MLFAAANSVALSLGRHRGVTLIGRPLDISVQVVMDAQEDIAGLCLDADVFYADSKVDKSRIRVTAEKAPGAQDAVIRIRSSNPVDEPVVTTYLRVGCQQKTERRYVTLADLAPDMVPDRNGVVPTAPQMQVLPPRLPMQPATGDAQPSVSAATANTAKKSRKNRKSTDAASAAAPADVAAPEATEAPAKSGGKKRERAAAASSAAKAGPANRARLTLEPLDLTIDRDPQLKPSVEMLSTPASTPQERSAAAAMWRALIAQPQDILRDAEKLQTLESSVRSLQTQSQKTQQSVNELDTKLQKAESERYANPLVYALVAFLLLAMGALVYLLRRQDTQVGLAGGDRPWWRRAEGEGPQALRQAWDDGDKRGDAFDLNRESDIANNPPKAASQAVPATSDLDLNLARFDLNPPKQDSNFDSDSMPSLSSNFPPDFALSMPYASRAMKAEELFDVQQQADFFVSIGQHKQAIEVLRNHIADGADTSALVYLDLFNLYHQLERRDDYEALREIFNRRFNTQIPVFDMYTDAGLGLEAYHSALSRIEALWPSPKVLEVIEDSIFRRPETNAEAFNLEAYRELLMLYSVAKEITNPEARAAAEGAKSKTGSKAGLPDTRLARDKLDQSSFLSTVMEPLSAAIDNAAADSSPVVKKGFTASTVPPASLYLGLDLDLSKSVAASEKPVPVDVTDAEFFAQFDEIPDAAPAAPEPAFDANQKRADSSGNLIDFDAFDSALGASEKFKFPKS